MITRAAPQSRQYRAAASIILGLVICPLSGAAGSTDNHPRLYTLSGEPYTPPARPTTPLPMIPSELLIVVTVIGGVCIIALVVIVYRKRKAP